MNKQKPLWKYGKDKNRNQFNWKALLGTTLTDKITTLRAAGYNKEEVYRKITNEYPVLTQEAKHRLKISISARFAEQDALLKRLNK